MHVRNESSARSNASRLSAAVLWKIDVLLEVQVLTGFVATAEPTTWVGGTDCSSVRVAARVHGLVARCERAVRELGPDVRCGQQLGPRRRCGVHELGRRRRRRLRDDDFDDDRLRDDDVDDVLSEDWSELSVAVDDLVVVVVAAAAGTRRRR